MFLAMKITTLIRAAVAKIQKSRLSSYSQKDEVLVKYGREQFKKLVEKGLSIPVVLL